MQTNSPTKAAKQVSHILIVTNRTARIQAAKAPKRRHNMANSALKIIPVEYAKPASIVGVVAVVAKRFKIMWRNRITHTLGDEATANINVVRVCQIRGAHPLFKAFIHCIKAGPLKYAYISLTLVIQAQLAFEFDFACKAVSPGQAQLWLSTDKAHTIPAYSDNALD